MLNVCLYAVAQSLLIRCKHILYILGGMLPPSFENLAEGGDDAVNIAVCEIAS